MIENLPGEDQPQIFGANENALHECNREQCFQLIEQLLQFEPYPRGMIKSVGPLLFAVPGAHLLGTLLRANL